MSTERNNALDVDALAQEIRRVDGEHKLGAGALAEALLPFIEQHIAAAPSPVAQPQPVMWFEAEESARGLPAKQVIGSMVFSTRIHTKEPKTNNPVWTLYDGPVTVAVAQPQDERELPLIIKFLLGEEDINGMMFGDPPPEGKGRFWWRTQLREYAARAATPAQDAVDAELGRDAMRYRWLKETGIAWFGCYDDTWKEGEWAYSACADVDALVDAAMQAQGAKE